MNSELRFGRAATRTSCGAGLITSIEPCRKPAGMVYRLPSATPELLEFW